MKQFFSSLRFRLLLLVLLALVPSVGLVLYTASEQRRLAAIQAQENALRLARTAARSQEQLVDGTQQLLMVLAQIPAVRDRVPTACTEILATLLKDNPRYTSFSVIERDGTSTCYAVPPTDNPTRSLPAVLQGVVEQALETRNWAVSGYGIGPYSRRRVIGFGYPILDEARQSQAVVTTMLDVVLLNDLAAQSLLPPGSTLTANDRTGTILARYPNPEQWVGRAVPDAPIFQTILNHTGEGTTITSGEDGVMRLYAFTPLQDVPGTDIYVSVGIPTTVAFAEADQGLTRNLIALGLVAVLTLGAAWVSSDLFVLRQVRDLLGVTGRLADGDLSARTALRHGAGELNQLARAFDRMVMALEQREMERKREEHTRAELLHRVITAQEDERMRIARELHDETGHSLTTLIMGLDTARLGLTENIQKVDEYLQTTKCIAEEMFENIHCLIEDLRPHHLDVLGLVPAIAWCGEQRLNPLGIALHLDTADLPGRLPPTMEIVLFRIAQEALNNVARHARATEVNVGLSLQDSHAILQIADNGQGFDPGLMFQEKSFGLRGMRERVSILGGEFRLQSARGKGTLITVRVPIPREEVTCV